MGGGTSVLAVDKYQDDNASVSGTTSPSHRVGGELKLLTHGGLDSIPLSHLTSKLKVYQSSMNGEVIVLVDQPIERLQHVIGDHTKWFELTVSRTQRTIFGSTNLGLNPGSLPSASSAASLSSFVSISSEFQLPTKYPATTNSEFGSIRNRVPHNATSSNSSTATSYLVPVLKKINPGNGKSNSSVNSSRCKLRLVYVCLFWIVIMRIRAVSANEQSEIDSAYPNSKSFGVASDAGIDTRKGILTINQSVHR
jgi:hypothetical protein